MKLRNQLRSVDANFKRKLAYYRAVAAHDRTPRLSKLLLGAAVGYALLPFDLIPDFLPVVGHLDDAIIIPGLVVLAIRLVPKDILEECRQVSNSGAAQRVLAADAGRFAGRHAESPIRYTFESRRTVLTFWPRGVAVSAAAVLAILELIDVFRIDVPVAALVLAILFALGAILVARGGRWPALLIGVPALVDLAGVVTFYGPPEGTVDVVDFILLGAFSALALFASLWLMVRPERRETASDV